MVNLCSLLSSLRFFKIRFPILFSRVLLWKEKNIKFLNFFLGQGTVANSKLQYSWEEEATPLPPLAPLGADRSFIIGTEMV